ncbi:MAG: hypothetical protein JRI75_09705 [Deltaproteobacteria bacterium]|nr:hypothetical protein [Deltaproteobacteria bacterium]
MSSYQKEQLEAISLIFRHLSRISVQEKEKLRQEISDYLSFRREVDAFLSKYFGDICTQKCYHNQRSACCSREGIITFFADTVVNVLVSRDGAVKSLMAVLQKPNMGFKCIYLGNHGCMWQVKPIVCEMFLCKQAKTEVFEENPAAGEAWEKLNQLKKRFTWPDRPVLFDALERYFMDAGHSSSLMYMHNSPGLLRVKQNAKKSKQK